MNQCNAIYLRNNVKGSGTTQTTANSSYYYIMSTENSYKYKRLPKCVRVFLFFFFLFLSILFRLHFLYGNANVVLSGNHSDVIANTFS